jgi:hypothetical protein
MAPVTSSPPLDLLFVLIIHNEMNCGWFVVHRFLLDTITAGDILSPDVRGQSPLPVHGELALQDLELGLKVKECHALLHPIQETRRRGLEVSEILFKLPDPGLQGFRGRRVSPIALPGPSDHESHPLNPRAARSSRIPCRISHLVSGPSLLLRHRARARRHLPAFTGSEVPAGRSLRNRETAAISASTAAAPWFHGALVVDPPFR